MMTLYNVIDTRTDTEIVNIIILYKAHIFLKIAKPRMGGTCYTCIRTRKWSLTIIKCPTSEFIIHVHKPGKVRNVCFLNCAKVWSILADMGVNTKITIIKTGEILLKVHIK